MPRGFDIGVVGGGASAVCLIDALACTDIPPGGLSIFEPSPHLWRGRAYQPDTHTVRVNAPPDDMSVRIGDPGHFERWIDNRLPGRGAAHADPHSGVPFLPRALYGEYLEQTALSGLAMLRQRGWQIEVVRAGVCAALRTADRVVLRTEHGRHRAVDYAVLCVGGGRPQDTYGLAGAPRFIADPYPLSQTLAGVRPGQHVAVAGSGLTAVDVVLGLAARGHRGPISLLSRQGVLPAVRQRPVPLRLRTFTAERFRALAARDAVLTLADLLVLMREELAAAGADEELVLAEIAAVENEDPVERLRRQLAAVDSPEPGLRILQHAVPETGPDVWPLLVEHDRSAVMESHYRAIMSLCCPMPPASGATLLRLLDSGQLRVRSGARGLEPTGRGFRAIAGTEAVAADVVVNAVSAPRDRIPPVAARLIRSLLSARVAELHHRGGLAIERATSRVTVAGVPDRRLYALGDLAAGSLFFTFGIPSLVDRAADIVASMRSDALAPHSFGALASAGSSR